MVITLFNSGKKKIQLHIEKSYLCPQPVISLGSDCHPAYVLKCLHIRNYSFPFDWLYTIAHTGMDYVNDNIKHEFTRFIDKLGRNGWGEVASGWYENSAFLHYTDLIENIEQQKAFIRRSKRFLLFFKTKPCLFLHNFPAVELDSPGKADGFTESVKQFHSLSELPHRLFIYVRFDEENDDNRENAEYLVNKLNQIPLTRADIYVRHKKQFGVWGDRSTYYGLLKKMGISLKTTLPKIYFSSGKPD